MKGSANFRILAAAIGVLLAGCKLSANSGANSSASAGLTGGWHGPSNSQDILPNDPLDNVTAATNPSAPNDLNYGGSGPLWNFYHPNNNGFFLAGGSTDGAGHYTSTFPVALAGRAGVDINARMGWAQNVDCSGVRIGIIDSGIDRDHPELAGNIYQNSAEIPGNGIDDDHNGYVDDVYGWNFVGAANGAGNNNTQDDLFHGTFVAGIIGAEGNNNTGITGICWRAEILPIKAFDSSGRGAASDIIEAIHYSRIMGAKITNNSYGGYYDPDHSYSDLSAMQEYQNAIEMAGQAGNLFIAAAGNGVRSSTGSYVGVNIETYMYKHVPAIIGTSNMITVANTNASDSLSASSNYGPNKVQVAAPGELVTSTYPHAFTDYLSATGTSFSTPHVVGAAALYWSAHPFLTAAQVKSRLLSFAETDAALNGKIKNSARLNLGDLMNHQRGTRP